jgi:hypothetical protein
MASARPVRLGPCESRGMIGLGPVVGLREHSHELNVYCLACAHRCLRVRTRTVGWRHPETKSPARGLNLCRVSASGQKQTLME